MRGMEEKSLMFNNQRQHAVIVNRNVLTAPYHVLSESYKLNELLKYEKENFNQDFFFNKLLGERNLNLERLLDFQY